MHDEHTSWAESAFPTDAEEAPSSTPDLPDQPADISPPNSMEPAAPETERWTKPWDTNQSQFQPMASTDGSETGTTPETSTETVDRPWDEPSRRPEAEPLQSNGTASLDLEEVAWDGTVTHGHVEIQPDGSAEISVETIKPFSTETPRANGHDPNAMLAIFRSLDQSEHVRENYTRAPVGYPGSKAKSISQILPYLPYRRSYCEPFGGSGSVLLARHAVDLEVYNDRFGGIVSFYRCLRDPKKWQELRERIELTVHSREEFIFCKETWESQDVTDDLDRAFRWYYMHMNSFGHQGRNFGRAGRGGKNQHGAALRNNAKMFAGVHYRLKNVLIENQDWRQILADFDHPDNVFYLDPPYVKFDQGIYKHSMTKADHIEMCERIQHLDSFVALSGYYDPETVELYGRYPWDRILTWNSYSSAVALAFTETNNRKGHEGKISRHKTVEGLWIREAP